MAMIIKKVRISDKLDALFYLLFWTFWDCLLLTQNHQLSVDSSGQWKVMIHDQIIYL